MTTKEIQDFMKENHDIHPRHTIRILQKMKNSGYIIKSRIKKEGKRPKWIIISDDANAFHQFYFIGTKNRKNEFTLKSLEELRKKWNKNLDEIWKSNELNDEKLFDIITLIMSAIHWHKMLTFAINSYWFGHSKTEVLKAKQLRTDIENFINTTFYKIWEKTPEQAHNLQHIIHDTLLTQIGLPKSFFKR